ncbi:hypothetical protein V8E53_007970 [Lactarius tabidus]
MVVPMLLLKLAAFDTTTYTVWRTYPSPTPLPVHQEKRLFSPHDKLSIIQTIFRQLGNKLLSSLLFYCYHRRGGGQGGVSHIHQGIGVTAVRHDGSAGGVGKRQATVVLQYCTNTTVQHEKGIDEQVQVIARIETTGKGDDDLLQISNVNRHTPNDGLNLKPPPERMSKLYHSNFVCVNGRTSKVLQGEAAEERVRGKGGWRHPYTVATAFVHQFKMTWNKTKWAGWQWGVDNEGKDVYWPRQQMMVREGIDGDGEVKQTGQTTQLVTFSEWIRSGSQLANETVT